MTDRVSKIHRIDSVANSWSRDDILEEFRELHLFGDEVIAERTLGFMDRWAPDYFFEIPSAGSGKYHPPDEYNTGGNVLHTKRVFLAYEQLARSYTEQQLLTADEYHAGQSAALLHDMLKFGWPSERNDRTVSDHGVLVAELIREKSDLPKIVADACASHNGAWGDGPTPQTNLEQIVHLADMTVTPRWYYSDVIEPSKRLKQLDVETVDGDELQ